MQSRRLPSQTVHRRGNLRRVSTTTRARRARADEVTSVMLHGRLISQRLTMSCHVMTMTVVVVVFVVVLVPLPSCCVDTLLHCESLFHLSITFTNTV